MYFLPDPTWERPFIPCKKFVSNNDGFFCDDEYYREEANWTITGKNNGTWMPDLITINYKISGNYLILSPFQE